MTVLRSVRPGVCATIALFLVACAVVRTARSDGGWMIVQDLLGAAAAFSVFLRDIRAYFREV